MYRYTVSILTLSLCVLPTIQTQAKPDDSAAASQKVGAPTITVTKLNITDKTLKLTYDIRNASKQDIWILAGCSRLDASAEVFMDKDERTLLIRARFDVPTRTSSDNAYGRYVLLRPGQTRAESVTLAVPVYPEYAFGGGRTAHGLEYATRLSIEFGYYTGDLPGMIRSFIEQANRTGYRAESSNDKLVKQYFRGPLYFNKLNEVLRQRDEEIMIPYTDQNLKGEQVLRTVVENLHIPYEEKFSLLTRPDSPNVPPCIRAQIQFYPSMLEYCFPYAGQQSLLSAAERQSLKSDKTIVVEDSQALLPFVNKVNEAVPAWGGIVRETNTAHVVCYDEDERPTPFAMYSDSIVVTNPRDIFTYWKGTLGLRKLIPTIRPFEFRVECAANLRNLWNRVRSCHKVEKFKNAYLSPTEWGDVTSMAFENMIIDPRIGTETDIVSPYMCPAAGEGKNHYAMNLNCKPDSPADMVLLFETKAGWNQHGGPELFTFDNHDPKGGCVLFNDGTVKFIRTQEELQQLRWK